VRPLVNRIRHTGGTGHAEFLAGYRDLIDRCVAAGITRIALVEPFLIPVDESHLRMLPALEEKMRPVAQLARADGLRFVRLQQAFTEAARQRDPAELVLDGVHPEPAGHDLIAERWLDVVRPLIGATHG